jgi:hypothetical protein
LLFSHKKTKKKGKGRRTVKRKQADDEKKAKQEARQERRARMANVIATKTCPTYLSAAKTDPSRASQPVPRQLFTQHFFYGVFQLVIGDQFSNTRLFDQTLRNSINNSFNNFIREHPTARCHKLTSPAARNQAVGFAEILTSTAVTCSTSFTNHVVENFDEFYIRYLKTRLLRLIPVSTYFKP